MTSTPLGINCSASSSPCTHTFDDGVDVTLTPQAAGGYTFQGFGGACSGLTCPLTMDGNKSVTAAFADVTPPNAPAITSPASNEVKTSTTGGAVLVAFNSNGDPTTTGFRCRVDNNSPNGAASCSSPWSTGLLSTGAHTVYVWALDSANNLSGAASRTFKVVNLASATLSGTPSAGALVNSATTAFTYSGGDSQRCKLDAGVYGPCQADWSPADGEHTLYVQAGVALEDTTYWNDTPVSRTWSIDTHTPNLTLDPSGPTGAVSSQVPAFSFSADDPAPGTAVTVTCSLDGGPFEACSSPVEYGAQADGPHTFDVRATDAAGNSTTASRSWTVDTVSPATDALTKKPALRAPSRRATFAFSGTDSGPTVSFQCSLDGAAFTACSSPKTYDSLAQGPHTFHVRARDAAGNTDDTPTSYTWRVDTIAPQTTIKSGPPSGTRSRSATFKLGSSEVGSRFRCRLDNGWWKACTATKRYTNLSRRLHTFRVKAIDRAGNVDPTPARRIWRIK